MADLITGNTQLGATKQDLISALVQKELAFATKLLPLVTDVSRFAVKGAKSISFPKLSSFTVTNRASGASGDSSVLTATVDQLLLDKNAYIAWIVDSFDAVQSSIDAEMEFAARAAAAHGRYVDSAIVTELETVGIATTTVGAISRDIILEMREGLLSKNADLSKMSLVVGVDSETAMLKVSEFTQAQIYGSANIPNGLIGKVYGVNVYVSNAIGASTYYMFDSDGLAIGFQQGAQMSEQGANQYGTGAKRVAMDQLFGVKGLEIAQAGAAAGKSALVYKDNN